MIGGLKGRDGCGTTSVMSMHPRYANGSFVCNNLGLPTASDVRFLNNCSRVKMQVAYVYKRKWQTRYYGNYSMNLVFNYNNFRKKFRVPLILIHVPRLGFLC